MKLAHAIGLALLAGAASGVHAQQDEKFRSLDRNADGFISREEAGRIKGYDYAFGEADDNRDGRLDATEFVKAESVHARQQATVLASDGTLTAKVKTALLRERGIKSTDVHVQSERGVVFLSGWVNTEADRARVAKVASLVDGVKEVRNGLAIR